MREFLRLFNQEEFFEAHEILEELWQEYSAWDRTFYQGLIQIAVALEHRLRGNLKGARGVLSSARRRLEPHLPHHEGFDLERLLAEAARFVEHGGDAPQLPEPADPMPG
jgi:predicted metal-dependent hydrolase